MLPRQFLSAGLATTAEESYGVPFNGSHVCASGNLVVPLGQIPILAPPTPMAHGKVMIKPEYQAGAFTAPDQRVAMAAMQDGATLDTSS